MDTEFIQGLMNAKELKALNGKQQHHFRFKQRHDWLRPVLRTALGDSQKIKYSRDLKSDHSKSENI